MIRTVVLETPVARGIARKSGFRPGVALPGREGLGTPILAIPPAVYVLAGTVSAPV